MKTATPTPAKPVPTPAELFAALHRRINELSKLDKDLLAEQLALEGTGATPVEPSTIPTANRRALELMNGEAPAGMVAGMEADARLFTIIVEREAIGKARHVLGMQLASAHFPLAAAVIAEKRDRWGAITRKRVVALLALRAANREAWAFKAEANAAAGLRIDWPGDFNFSRLFDTDFHGDTDAARFLEGAVAEGFAKASEIR